MKKIVWCAGMLLLASASTWAQTKSGKGKAKNPTPAETALAIRPKAI